MSTIESIGTVYLPVGVCLGEYTNQISAARMDYPADAADIQDATLHDLAVRAEMPEVRYAAKLICGSEGCNAEVDVTDTDGKLSLSETCAEDRVIGRIRSMPRDDIRRTPPILNFR